MRRDVRVAEEVKAPSEYSGLDLSATVSSFRHSPRLRTGINQGINQGITHGISQTVKKLAVADPLMRTAPAHATWASGGRTSGAAPQLRRDAFRRSSCVFHP